MLGLVVTPVTWSRAASSARLPLTKRSRLRSSSQIDTPAFASTASRLVIEAPPSGTTAVTELHCTRACSHSSGGVSTRSGDPCLRALAVEHAGQHGCLADLRLTRRSQQGQRRVLRKLPQMPQRFRPLRFRQLSLVAPAEL